MSANVKNSRSTYPITGDTFTGLISQQNHTVRTICRFVFVPLVRCTCDSQLGSRHVWRKTACARKNKAGCWRIGGSSGSRHSGPAFFSYLGIVERSVPRASDKCNGREHPKATFIDPRRQFHLSADEHNLPAITPHTHTKHNPIYLYIYILDNGGGSIK